jgi:hypothetical protein
MHSNSSSAPCNPYHCSTCTVLQHHVLLCCCIHFESSWMQFASLHRLHVTRLVICTGTGDCILACSGRERINAAVARLATCFLSRCCWHATCTTREVIGHFCQCQCYRRLSVEGCVTWQFCPRCNSHMCKA